MSYDLTTYDPDADFDHWYTDATGARIRARLDEMRARTVLEIGCATGRMTAQLVNPGAVIRRRVLAMDLDEAMLVRAGARDLPDVEWVHGDVLDLAPAVWRALRPFEAVVCCSVLHEVESPAQILWRAHELLAPRGIVFVTVPNAASIHFEGHPRISARGAQYGVRRLWTLEEWASKLGGQGTGLEVAYMGEMVLKPYPNAAMERLPGRVLDFLAGYRGPGGAICYFELERG